ncbi:hypothetical protein ABIE73_000821 [Bradyrhizobium yuanmingense]
MRAIDPRDTELLRCSGSEIRPEIGDGDDAAGGIGDEIGEVAHLADHPGSDDANAWPHWL